MMAQRYGGKYSPDGARAEGDDLTLPEPAAKPVGRSRDERRAGLLFLIPLVFVFFAFRGAPGALLLGLAACGLLLGAAWLTREGILAHQAFDARRVARRPAIPRKIFGALLTGAGLTLGAMMTQQGVLYPVLFGVVGAVLHFGAFGADPLADKGMAGVDQFQTDRVARAVAEAEVYLKAMKDAILRTGDRNLEARVDRFTTTARAMFRSIESDPGDLTATRKYLSVYLMGARDATVKFADIYAQNKDPKPRADYEALLTDLETNFAGRTQALLANNHTDLDVEIAVLRDRLKLEG